MRPSARLCRSSQCLFERINLQAEVSTVSRASRRTHATQTARSALPYIPREHNRRVIQHLQKLTVEAWNPAPSSKAVDNHAEAVKPDTNSASTKHETQIDQTTDTSDLKQDSTPSMSSQEASEPTATGLFPTPNSNNFETSNDIQNPGAETEEKRSKVPFRLIHPRKSKDELTPEVASSLFELIDLIHYHANTLPDLVPIRKIFELYDQLPFPKVCYIPRRAIRLLFVILSRQPVGLISNTERHLKLISDLRTNGSTIRQTEWTGAIDSIGKGFAFTHKTRLQEAMKAASEMQFSGIQPDVAVLVSLLQAAIREGNSPTARTVENEIKRCDMKEDILIWTERIRAAGKQEDARHVHATFQRFCESGVAADIIFINELLKAFLNVKQGKLAEVIYSALRTFAKAALDEHPYEPVRSIFETRQERRDSIGTPRSLALRQREIDLEFEKRRIDPADLLNPDGSPNELYQEIFRVVGVKSFPFSAMLIPNRGTINLFISYHCHYTGRMDDVLYYLNEMDVFGAALVYGNYVDLLHGFFMWHTPGSAWTADRLRAVFSFIRNGVEKWKPPFPITYVVVTSAIKAFGRVEGGKSAREVWELLRPWLVINENVEKRKEEKIGYLEELVVMFEKGKDLSVLMANKDWRWKVIEDWRKRY
jgi:hypothetical protein